MAANEQNENRPGPAAGGVSSQAGLAAYHGGRSKSLPSVPSPGQPGSRFNPVVLNREDQTARREAAALRQNIKGPGRKSLDIGMPPGMIQGVPPEILKPSDKAQGKDAQAEEPGVTEAAAKGFAGGFVTGAQAQGMGGPQQETKSGSVTAPDDSLPGMAQPVIVEAVDAVQGKSPAASGSKKVVMNPVHVATLAALDNKQDNGPERAGDSYGR
jgi:hypothetical protein